MASKDDCKKYAELYQATKASLTFQSQTDLEGLTPNAQLAGGVTGGAEIED